MEENSKKEYSNRDDLIRELEEERAKVDAVIFHNPYTRKDNYICDDVYIYEFLKGVLCGMREEFNSISTLSYVDQADAVRRRSARARGRLAGRAMYAGSFGKDSEEYMSVFEKDYKPMDEMNTEEWCQREEEISTDIWCQTDPHRKDTDSFNDNIAKEFIADVGDAYDLLPDTTDDINNPEYFWGPKGIEKIMEDISMKDVNSKKKNDRNGESKHILDDFGIFKSILRNVNDLGLDTEAFRKGVAEGIKLSSKFKALEEKERDTRTAYENGLRAGMAIVEGIEKDPYSQSTKDKLDDAVESFRKVTGTEIPNQFKDVTEAVKHAVENTPRVGEKREDSVEKPRLEPIVQDRVARNGLPYKVSYGVSLATCGNTLPRSSVVVEPKCFDMKPMCMCVQEIAAYPGADPDRYLGDVVRPNECRDRLDITFTVNTNGVDLMHDLAIDGVASISDFTVPCARIAAGDLLDVLTINGFFDAFYKRTGYMTKCDPSHILTGMTIIPSVWNKGQFVVKITMPGRFNEVLFTAIAMEYIRLLMVTFASKTLLPKCSEYNVNMPSFEEIFYINLITDVNMVIENIWKLIDLINASRENDTNPENN